MNKILYHGSKTAGIKVLKPFPHNAVSKREVVFATSDIRFALAMMHGTGNDLAVGYFVNTKTHEERMYIDELKPDALKQLEESGVVYEVESENFYQDPTLSHVEFVSDNEVSVKKETHIPNVLQELKKYDIDIVSYEKVLEAMKVRGKKPGKPKKAYKKDRFKEINL